MMKLQNNYFNVMAEDMRPVLLKYVQRDQLKGSASKYLELVENWDLFAGPDSKGQTIYQTWFDSLNRAIWWDDLSQVKPELPFPDEETTMELLKRDSTSMAFIDDRRTPETETLAELVTGALNRAAANLAEKEKDGKLEWAAFKNPTIYHLLKQSKKMIVLGRQGLHVGGYGNIINAITHSHGPSWRMIVQMGPLTEAWGVYPGGQSGNPGSRFYDNFIDTWATGQYFSLWLMKKSDALDKRVKWTMQFEPEA